MNQPFGLYVILTDPTAGYEVCAEAAVAAEVRYLQLRMKNRPPLEILNTAQKIEKITRDSNTLFIVNDDVQIAMDAYADGVHLGQEDMKIDLARRIWNDPSKIYGISTHNRVQADKAVEGQPDYIGVGPIYSTPTKVIPDPVVGLKNMKDIISSNPLPAVAIGGINADNLHDVLNHGALNFSVVRPIMNTSNPKAEIKRLMEIWHCHLGEKA